MAEKSTCTGRVIEERKNYFVVDTEIGRVQARTKGTLKKNHVRVCAGDIVNVEIINEDTHEGIIVSVQKRSRFLNRPMVANIDQIFFINTLLEPSLDLEALDRFLFTAAVFELPATLVFNKVDLLDNDDTIFLKEISAYYESAGYKRFYCSAQSGSGLEELISACKNKLTAFTGPSGVGKSTLLSRIYPDFKYRIGEVSGARGRGTHTTTHIYLIKILESSFIADTPGFAFVDIPTVPEEDVILYFPEFEKRIGQCKYNNCNHINEPGCSILELVEKKEIASWRHDHYVKIRSEMRDRRKEYRK